MAESNAIPYDHEKWLKECRERQEWDLQRSQPLLCDKCGKDTGTWVSEFDLEGSYFFCNTCKESA